MQHAERLTLAEMREFLAASNTLSFAGAGRRQIYGLVERTLRAQQYLRLSKKDKGVVRRYLAKISGRSLPQITRLIRQYRHSGAVRVSPPQRRRFPRRYTPNDIALLAAVDAAHEGLSGPAVRHILRREYTVYNKAAYQRLASIWRPTSTTCGGGRPIVNTTFITPRPAPAGCRSASGASPTRAAGPADFGSTRCIRETPRRTRASTTSTLSIRSRSGRSWAVARRSRKPI